MVLSIFAAPLAFLYVDSLRWAGISFAVSLVMGVAGFMLPGRNVGLLSGLISIVLLALWIWRAYRFAGAARDGVPRPWYSRWHGLVGISAALALVMLVIRIFLFEPFRAPSASMLPTVPLWSSVLVQKWGYGHHSAMGYSFGHGGISAPVSRGDIIAFDYPIDPSTTYIKRVVGLPGDKIVYRDKHVTVNGVDVRGKPLGEYLDSENLVYLQRYREKLDQTEFDILLNEPRMSWNVNAILKLPSQCSADHEVLSCTVPAASYFVMGDNRDNSSDSRYWGFVPAKAVVGKVVYIVSPRI